VRQGSRETDHGQGAKRHFRPDNWTNKDAAASARKQFGLGRWRLGQFMLKTTASNGNTLEQFR
jgi:hypothetical protein